VIFIGSFVDDVTYGMFNSVCGVWYDVTYVRDVEVCMWSTVCFMPGYICYGSENFGLRSLLDDYVGVAGVTPQFCSIAPHTFDYRFVDE